jgi:hypothetical protein
MLSQASSAVHGRFSQASSARPTAEFKICLFTPATPRLDLTARRLRILARGAGSVILPNAWPIFDVELLGVKG